MDLNFLYHRHGSSLLMAEHASCEQSRLVHLDLAAAYAEQIADRLRPGHEIDR